MPDRALSFPYSVRDAAARLPNGEGTRSDICELLRDSQFISPTVSDNQLNTVVSGALDRLHYEKDPCVKYDVNRKLWIYLHRNRTEEEFGTSAFHMSCLYISMFLALKVLS